MMGLLSLSFSAPYVLLALLALPGLWLLLRVNPPRPQTVPFPPLPLLSKTLLQQPEPRRLPLWLVILRIVLAALVIVASAGLSLHRDRLVVQGSGPVLLILDSGWAAADDWAERIAQADEITVEADQMGRPIALLVTGDANGAVTLQSPAIVKDRLHSLVPSAFAVDRAAALPKIERFLADHTQSEIVFLTDGLARERDNPILSRFSSVIGSHRLTLIESDRRHVALAGVSNSDAGLAIRVVRDGDGLPQSGRLRAYDAKSRIIGETPFIFEASARATTALFTLPTELRNEIARIEVDGVHSAGSVALIDGQNKRRKIGLVSGTSADLAQPLLSPNWFVAQALRPYADLIEPRGGVTEAVSALIDAKTSIIFMADIGSLSNDVEKHLLDYVEQGGVLVRFAGPRMVSIKDRLMPVRLRPGDRALGGALAWETTKTLAPFPSESPFAGLETPAEITITRQLLAEPDADLAHKTWAALPDGSPIVTAEKRKRGSIILFHITADTSWSSLPISGVFVGMLRRIVNLSAAAEGTSGVSSSKGPFAPVKTLNGFGVLGEPSPNDRPADRASQLLADHDHPAGLYGDPENPFALNVLDGSDTLAQIDFSGLDAVHLPLETAKAIDLRFWVLMMAALLFIADTLATFVVRGGGRIILFRPATSVFSLVILTGLILTHGAAKATPIAPKDAEGALQTHLAYVVTGDAELDEASRAGLSGLSLFIAQHTALEPGEVVGVDLADDDLAVYPLLYWPIAPGRPVPDGPSLSKVDAFMRDGGTVIFDTHDAALAIPGSDATSETRALRQVLAGLSVPELEPVPTDHVLTKAFYLIDRFPGRYAEGKTWIEALQPVMSTSDQPARAGDGVSPLIITSNDLAAAWAIDRNGQALYPLTQSMPRQREMAMRAGTNLVMYVLTGNYKADQVHVPALIERLGK